MKTNTGIYILGMLLLLTACYKDKGNYAYQSINEIKLTFSPVSEKNDDSYIFALPQKDSLFFELTPVVEQTEMKNESNLEYRWIIPDGETKDTVYSKSYMFKFPPRKTKNYGNVLFSVKDLTTGLETYRKVLVKTIVPFIKSWLVLHGKDGDRKIAALEYDATQTQLQRQVGDIYESIKETRRFKNAFAMDFTSSSDLDMLFILEPDSCFVLDPFECEVKKTNTQMLPPSSSGHFRICCSHHPGTYVGAVDSKGRLYHSGAWGYFYNAKADGDFKYHADRIYVSKERYYTIWDDVNKKFMYYNSALNWYKPWEDARQSESDLNAQISLFPSDIAAKMNTSGKNVLWMGCGLTSASASGASVLLQDVQTRVYHMLHIGYGGKDKAGRKEDDKPVSTMTADTLTLGDANFEEDSQFASTYVFSNQLFYSLEDGVYLYNLITRDKTLLYSAGEGRKITKLAFRLEGESTMSSMDAERILGIAVETPDGKGEFHEIFLDGAGDVTRSAKYDGFGPIVDFLFTHLVHQRYDIL